ncbi:MAG: signal peptidase I [Thermoproteota archaeon]
MKWRKRRKNRAANRMNRRVKDSLNTLITVFIIPAVILMVAISVLSSVMGTSSPIAVVEIDMSPWYVSSMYPTLYPGDLLLLTGDIKDLKVGDIIVYRNPYSYRNSRSINVVHRIVGIKTDANGVKRYITKGDYNLNADPYSPGEEDILGKWTGLKIHFLGFLLLFVNSPPLIEIPLIGEVPWGRVMLVIILIAMLVWEVTRSWRSGEDSENQAL